MKFWQDLVVDHGLNGGPAESLRPPTEPQTVSKALGGALNICHAANPAVRTSVALTRHLALMPQPNETDVFGICKGTMESPSLSRPMAKLVAEHVLKMIGRTRADEAFPQHWNVVKDYYDAFLCGSWAVSQCQRQTRAGFLRARRLELQLLVDMDLCTTVEAMLQSGKYPDANAIAKLGKMALIGAELYAPEALKLESTLFVGEGMDKLRELEMQHFAADELVVFKRLMMASAEALDDEIWKQFDAATLTLPFLNGEVVGTTSNPNDDWSWRLEARVKTLGVSTLKVVRTTWEEMLFGPTGPIPTLPETITIGDDLCFDFNNGRDYINRVVGHGWQSIEAIKRCVRQHADEWLRMDASAWMDIYFWEQVFDEKIAERLKGCAVECLPREQRSLPKAVVAARMVATGEIATAQKKVLQDVLNAVADLLSDVCEGRGPSAAQMGQMCEYTVQFLKRCEQISVFVDCEEVDGHVVRTTLLGQAALMRRFELCTEKEGVQDPKDLREFRSFCWMLIAEQCESAQNWEAAAVRSAKERQAQNKAKALKDIEQELNSEKEKKRSPATSSGLQIVSAPPLKDAKVERQSLCS